MSKHQLQFLLSLELACLATCHPQESSLDAPLILIIKSNYTDMQTDLNQSHSKLLFRFDDNFPPVLPVSKLIVRIL